MPKKKQKTSRAARVRALSVLARMRRRGESLSEAAHLERTTPRTVRRLLGKQLRRDASRRYSATSGDTLRRDINVFSADGYVPVTIRSSKQAQLASEHLIAVERYRRTLDTAWLKPFIGKRVGGIELLTDPDRLQILDDAGLSNLDSFYQQQRGGKQES